MRSFSDRDRQTDPEVSKALQVAWVCQSAGDSRQKGGQEKDRLHIESKKDREREREREKQRETTQKETEIQRQRRRESQRKKETYVRGESE